MREDLEKQLIVTKGEEVGVSLDHVNQHIDDFLAKRVHNDKKRLVQIFRERAQLIEEIILPDFIMANAFNKIEISLDSLCDNLKFMVSL